MKLFQGKNTDHELQNLQELELSVLGKVEHHLCPPGRWGAIWHVSVQPDLVPKRENLDLFNGWCVFTCVFVRVFLNLSTRSARSV